MTRGGWAVVFAALVVLATGCGGPPFRPAPGEAWVDPLTGIEFRYCPPGTFLMGTPEESSFQVPDQQPRHSVTLRKGFWLGRREVSRSQWEGHPMAEGPGSEPVTGVSWLECQSFIERLNQQAGAKAYRLPTEAEWEYACSAGEPPKPYFGPGSSGVGATYEGIGGPGQFHPWGLESMLGSCREWCSDWGGPYPAGPVMDPQGPDTGRYRVNRGGHGQIQSRQSHPTWRAYYTPDFRDDDLGFRLVRAAR